MKQTLRILGLVCLFMLTSATAAHAGSNSIATIICEVVSWLWGPIGTTIAMLGVITLGVTAMFGKIAIPNILITMAGISLIFGAPEILNSFGLPASCQGTSAAAIIGSPLYRILSCITGWFNGPYGKALATLAVIMLGLFAMNGRISYHQAIIVGAGIATIMGASSIIGSMGIPVQSDKGYSKIGLYPLAYKGYSKIGLYPLAYICPTGTLLESVFCNVTLWFQGPIAKGIATLSIVILGLGALFGKIGWGLSVVTGVGIALMMGAVTIANSMGVAEVSACKATRKVPVVTTPVPTLPTVPIRPVKSTTTPTFPGFPIPGGGSGSGSGSGSGGGSGSGSGAGSGSGSGSGSGGGGFPVPGG